MTSRPPVACVTRLVLGNFKGFRGRTDLDLDANIVLLTGRNGYGKTSVIEALELLFTGSWVDRRDPASGTPDWSQLVNRPSGAETATLRAEVELTLPEAPRATLNARIDRGSEPQVDTEVILRDVGIGPCWDAARLVREVTFYYQDGLNALMRLSRDAQARIVEQFVPSPALLAALPGPMGRARGRVVAQLQREGRRPEDEILDDCTAAAARTHEASQVLGGPYSTKKLSGVQEATVTDRLRPLAEALQVEVPLGSREDWREALLQIAAAAKRMASTPPVSEARTAAAEAPPRALYDLPEKPPSPEALSRRVSGGPRPSELEGECAALAARIEEMDRQIDQFWKAPVSADVDVTEGEPACPRGIVPLLLSLTTLSRKGRAGRRQFESAPDSVKRVVAALLDAAPPLDLETALVDAQKRLAALRESREATQGELDRKREALAQLHKLVTVSASYSALGLWLGRRSLKLADFVSPTDPDVLDVAALRKAAVDGADEGAIRAHGARWTELAAATEEWAKYERELSEQRSAPGAEVTRRREAVLHLWQSMEPAESRTKRDRDFQGAVRGRVLTEAHTRELNRALRSVLSRFALHYNIRRNIEMRPDFRKGIEYCIPEGDQGHLPRSERSLSTGQLNALAISLAVVLNLNRHNHPYGFLCLDDVSSAFDLDNLACDAAVIRALAYGPDPAKRRQVILAAHHDELTTRLLPLLRPPKGYALKVVQFTDWSRAEGATVEQWECTAADGDPTQVLELWRQTRGLAPS